MGRGQRVSQEEEYQYVEKRTSTGRTNLNDLLERVHAEKKRDNRVNFLILSGIVAVLFVVVLIISF